VVCHGSLSLLCMMKVRVWKQLLTFFFISSAVQQHDWVFQLLPEML
jgi:hypothetical protein